MKTKLSLLFLLICSGFAFAGSQEQRLTRWLKKYPDADANGDGRLTVQEVKAYREKLRGKAAPNGIATQRSAPNQFEVVFTHTGGGITGSARYKWEQENGIFQFKGNPKPKLLASISNAEWDAMMWGPYSNDRPAYYECWIDFCLKYNPHMNSSTATFPSADLLTSQAES